MSTYNLNPNSAKQADQIAGRIDQTGKYIGKFTRAENIKSTKGTKGVEFAFKSEDGRTADFLTLWTVNAEGKELFSLNTLNAIMTCLRVRSISPVKQQVEKYDREAGGKAKVIAEVFPELMDKPIGLILQREEYEGSNGTVKNKMVIFAAFDPATGFTASEILDKATKPETLERMLAAVRDRPLKPTSHGAVATSNANTGSFSDLDDFDSQDIPF